MKALALLALVALGLAGCTPDTESSNPAPATNAGTSDRTPGGNTSTNAQAPSRSSDDARVYPRQELQTVTVKLNGKPFHLWVMDTDGKRQEGMMFLQEEDVRDDEGMLFAFPEVQQAGEANGFWMRNTYLPLDIIYLSSDGRVVNVGKGVPLSEKTVPPAGSYQNVIELKAGTAARIGLQPGTKVELPKDLNPTSDPLPQNPSGLSPGTVP